MINLLELLTVIGSALQPVCAGVGVKICQRKCKWSALVAAKDV